MTMELDWISQGNMHQADIGTYRFLIEITEDKRADLPAKLEISKKYGPERERVYLHFAEFLEDCKKTASTWINVRYPEGVQS